MYNAEWTSLHWAAWNGRSLYVQKLLTQIPYPSHAYQHPLYLALSRWGHSPWHRKMVQRLWQAHPNPSVVRWGDTAWGGGLTLLDLGVDKELDYLVQWCKNIGMEPSPRTWNIALHHSSSIPLRFLSECFKPAEHLPPLHPTVAQARALWDAKELSRHTPDVSSGIVVDRRL